MALVTDDVVYAASVGCEPGATYRGRDEVRSGFERMLSHDRTIASHDGPLTIVGDPGFAQWEFIVDTYKDGYRAIAEALVGAVDEELELGGPVGHQSRCRSHQLAGRLPATTTSCHHTSCGFSWAPSGIVPVSR